MRFGILLGFAVVVSILVFIGIQLYIPQTPPPVTPVIPATPTEPDTPPPLEPLPLGRHFIIGHWANTPVASTTALIKAHQLAGVIIMSAPKNSEDIKVWTKEWQEAVSYPLIIAIDQEGGEVARLRGPQFDTTGQRDITSEEAAYNLGFTRGQELTQLGITMNFAPVLDTTTKASSFLFARTFPQDTVTLATALARGHTDANVTPVVKHFPGHPDTPHDSHLTLPTVLITQDERADFIKPFTQYLASKPAALMTAHVAFPNLDNKPATLSSYWLKTVLRNELGYTGLIITDDMSMNAIDDTWSTDEASRLALEAGADIILLAAEPADIIETLHSLQDFSFNLSDSNERIRAYLNQ